MNQDTAWPADRQPEIDLSLVTYNSQPWLAEFFASLTAQSYPLSRIHLHVTDHSPDPACLEALRLQITSLPFASTRLEQTSNRGFGAGHNDTLRLGRSRLVLVSNLDLTFEREAIARLVEAALESPRETVAWECRQKPFEHPKAYDILSGQTDWVSCACVMLRRSAWKQIGGFDERFFMYGEDVDLSFRLRAAGFLLRYCPRAAVWHHTYAEAEALKPAQYFGSTLANMELRLRFGTWWDRALGLLMQVALVAHRVKLPHRLVTQFGNYWWLAKNARYFLAPSPANADAPGQTRVKPAFSRWDYTLHRRGAFVAAREQPNNRPLVSIIVRTYPGRLPLLAQALQSLSAQTYRPLEVLVVEDGGATTREVTAAFDKPEQRLSMRHQAAPKKGRSHAGNLGLALARGEFMGFLDDDDLLFADHVETLVTALHASAAPAAFAHAWEVETLFPTSGWVPYKARFARSRMRPEFNRDALERANYLPIQTVLFRRESYDRLRGLDESLNALEDWDLWLRYADDGDFLYVDKTTSIYRIPANAEIRPDRTLALAQSFQSVRDRNRLTGTVPWYVTNRGQAVLRFLGRRPALYQLMRRIGSPLAIVLARLGSVRNQVRGAKAPWGG